LLFQLSEDHEQKASGESRKLVTDEVSPVVSNHAEEPGPPSVPHSEVSNQRQSTPKRTALQSSSVPNSSMMDGNPHSVVHVEDTVSAFSRAESFPVSGMLLQTSSANFCILRKLITLYLHILFLISFKYRNILLTHSHFSLFFLLHMEKEDNGFIISVL
jgi:hypothetical protein